jgi:hypothetical protein
MTTALLILAMLISSYMLIRTILFQEYYLRIRDNRILDLRNKNADLIDDNRAKAEALQNLIESAEALLNHDLYHTAETINELLENGFFEHSTLLDANAVDAVTDWSTLERFLERLEAARKAAQT